MVPIVGETTLNFLVALLPTFHSFSSLHPAVHQLQDFLASPPQAFYKLQKRDSQRIPLRRHVSLHVMARIIDVQEVLNAIYDISSYEEISSSKMSSILQGYEIASCIRICKYSKNIAIKPLYFTFFSRC